MTNDYIIVPTKKLACSAPLTNTTTASDW